MSELTPHAIARLRAGLSQPALPSRYRLIDIVGRGGMGVVWRARDSVLERDVAVKVLAEHIDGESFTRRIEQEARILARLEHPGIVAVHDAGTLDDGRGWYAMRLVQGDRLDRAAAHLLTLGDVLRVMLRLIDTVAFAHAQGVVHRDLTPGNVMLGQYGEVLILDWGVAFDLRQPEQPGTVIGTPGYMSPEQASGSHVDARSDLFSLGAILRDLLAVPGERIPRRLVAIRDRALQPEPQHRYPTAAALGADLRRFQDGEPVEAYREGPLEVAARLARRYQTAIVLVCAYLVMRLLVLWWKGL